MTPPNPFVGLRPYESSDSLFYFGRTAQTKTLLRQLHQHRFVAVVGSSGSGKSSLIRAGLIPQLEAGFLVQDRDQWRVVKLKPGDAPLENLAVSLEQILPAPPFAKEGTLQIELEATTGSPPLIHSFSENESQGEQGGFSDSADNGQLQTLVTAIREQGTQAVTDLLEPQLANSNTNLFILVDQFEELFRFGLGKGKTKQRQEAEEFVALLLSLTRHEWPIYVCLTMRSDFLGDCDAFYGLPEAINQSQFLVPRLTRQQRQEVITHPVLLAGAKIAPRLVDRLLNEGIDTRDDLPVLQHVLMRTWDVWRESGGDESGLPLDIAHYEKADTIHYALNSHADEALDELDERQQHIAKKLFQALTTVDAGNRQIRRPAHLNEVALIAEATVEEVLEVINCFRADGRAFLVLSSEDVADNPLIDISHESLIRQWETLKDWVYQEAEAAKTYLRLADSSHRYQRGKGNLLHDAELSTAMDWSENHIPESAGEVWAWRYKKDYWATIDFIEVSQKHEQKRKEYERQQQEEKIRLLEEKAELERQKHQLIEAQNKQQKNKIKITRRFAAMALIFGLVGSYFGTVQLYPPLMITSSVPEMVLQSLGI